MKKIILLLTLYVIAITSYAQGNSGLGFNYQAVIRGADGFVLPSKNVELNFSLFPGQHATTATWIETHKVKTDDFGTIGVIVGKGQRTGGTVENFADINFAGVFYWLKIELVDGSKTTLVNYSQLTSVPYAEVASNAFGMPAGSIIPFGGSADKVPAGWLLCDGREISRSEYANLYDAIAVSWGYGNNSTTFNVPDMRGMFMRGVSDNSGRDKDVDSRLPLKEGGNSGNNVGSYQEDAIRNITGTLSGQSGQESSTPNGTGAFTISGLSRYAQLTGGGTKMPNYSLSFDASNAENVSVGSDNRPQNVYVNYIIKY